MDRRAHSVCTCTRPWRSRRTAFLWGVARIEYDAPVDKSGPIEKHDAARWLRGIRDCATIAAEAGCSRLVSVMDQEANFFALFAERKRIGGIDLLVRARNGRSFGAGPEKLFDRMRTGSPGALLEIAL